MSAAALVVALGAWGGLRWSLIPVAVEGRIATVHYVSDNGYRLRELALTDGRSLIVDRDVVARFGSKDDLAGQSITKTAGDWSVQIGGKTRPLRPSVAFWQVTIALVALAAVSLGRRWARIRLEAAGRTERGCR